MQATLRALRLETEGLVADAGRIAEAIGVPLPRSVHEVCRVLTPHLPVTLNSRVIAKPFELAIFLAAPVGWLVAFWSRLPPGATQVVPMLLTIWLFLGLFLLARSVRVVLSARVLKLGPHQYPVSEIRAVHVQLPGWLSRRGERAKVTVETRFGLNAPIKMPNALGPLMKALRQSGVQVVQTGGLW